ncbi:cupin domain-containing protein [Govanella unica]|uniref:Cupin domain-containing protein n=1 Tax=Govanella unica TaxID=2975056 RepID=A0A9X3U0J1_9PROT|nr:cupin domain-containing protein [Govania unica]MDA5195027.1 cupin domain-containing protein [Govania unica]
MSVIDINSIEPKKIPGIVHRTLVGAWTDFHDLSIWMQFIDPGQETPAHRHDCEEAVVVLAGSGTCIVEGTEYSFGPNSVLLFKPNEIHKIINSGSEQMHVVGSLTAAPVKVETDQGAPLPLPWDEY